METKRDQAWFPWLLRPHAGRHRERRRESARGRWPSPCFHPRKVLSIQTTFPSACSPRLARASAEGRTPAPTLGWAFSQAPGVFTSW